MLPDLVALATATDNCDPDPTITQDQAPCSRIIGQQSFTVTPEMHLARLALDDLSWEIVVRDASQGLVVGDRVVLARSGELLVADWSPGEVPPTGPLVPVLQGVATSPGLGRGKCGGRLVHFCSASSVWMVNALRNGRKAFSIDP